MKSSLLFSFLVAVFATIFATTLVFSQDPPGLPTIPPQYGQMELFSMLVAKFQYFANTPIPEGCPPWVGENFGIIDKIIADSQAMSPATAKTLWNQYQLSPQISPSFDVDAFFDVIAIGQAKMLLRCHIAKHGGAIPADHRRANG